MKASRDLRRCHAVRSSPSLAPCHQTMSLPLATKPPSPIHQTAGQKRSTKNPLLRLELAPPVMLRFPSIEDRDAATNTMKELGERASAAAAPAAAAGTTGAPPAAAGAPARARAASGSGGGGAGSGAGARGGGPQQLAIPSEEDRRALLNSNRRGPSRCHPCPAVHYAEGQPAVL